MIRLLVSIVLPLLLPTVLYLVYAWHLGRRARARGGDGGAVPAEVDVPWSWLVLAGVVLAGVVLALISVAVNFIDTGAKPGAHYEPAHMENGKLVPGRTTP
ncbi:MAG: hypothetical protein IT562_15880 [Alphaproteobacteria bacterium]|nr:hypothetical protein [Alphaproteobacteria bacterium]